MLVHEHCKLIGRHGTPKYGSGVLSFPDFLDIMIANPKVNEEDRGHKNMALDQQVGGHYYVSKLFFQRIIN